MHNICMRNIFRPMNIKDTFDFQIRSTLFSMMRMYNMMIHDKEITQGIGYTLMLIPREGIPATSIAPIMGMGSSSLVRLLKSMEKQELIFRKHDKEDRRITKIFLTQKGVNLRKEIKKMVIDFNQKVMAQISDEELSAYRKVSETIKNQIDIDLTSLNKTK